MNETEGHPMRKTIISAALALLTITLVSMPGGVCVARTEKVALNFDEVDINIFLKTMSELTGKSFVLSDKVKGKISFVSSEEVPVDKVYDIVLTILEAQGFFVVPAEGNMLNVFPAQEALKMSGQIFYGTEEVSVPQDRIITQLIPLEYANVNDVLNVVRPLVANDVLITAYPRTNVLIANGHARDTNLLIVLVSFLDTEIPRAQSDINIYNLENSNAETIAQTLSNLASNIPVQRTDQKAPRPPTENVAGFTERFRVVANKETNSVIVISAPEDYEKIKKIVQELDVKRDQVLVEALIVEITLNDDQTLGFDWRVLIDTGHEADAIAQSNTGLVAESLATGGLAGLTVGLLNGDIPSVYAILNANKENTNFKILSTPEIVTIDNNEAMINIGEQIPFLSSSRVDENNNVIQTFDYKDIGILLKLTPHINKNGYITMDINQSIKKIVEGTSLLENPSVYNREINSRVTVLDRRTIVIGGLIRDDVTTVQQKVPVLGDIPILGLFFRKKSKTRVRTNLMIFLTPHIVTSDEQIQQITEKKREEQKAFEEKRK
jgi:general secretion pathway protein D